MPKFTPTIISILGLIAAIRAVSGANNVRFPVAYKGSKGWIGLEEGTAGGSGSAQQSAFTFDFSTLATNASQIEWAILKTPFVYGDETCEDLLRQRRANNTLHVGGPLDVSSSRTNGGGSWRGSAVVPASVASLQARSILLSEVNNGRALACANILSDDVLVFESRFYGPQIVGDVYFFLDTTTKGLKLFSRLSNGNNLEPMVNWTLKNKWWVPDVDYREPGWQSCRESGDKADTRYDPPEDSASLQPETNQFLDVKDWKSDSTTGSQLPASTSTAAPSSSQSSGGGVSSIQDDLEASVLVLKSHEAKSWDRYNVYGCSRIRLSDGWAARTKLKSKPPSNGASGDGMEQMVSFEQQSLFHPLLVRFKTPRPSSASSTNGSSSSSSWKPASHKDTNNATMFTSSNGTSRRPAGVNAQTPPPTFSLHQRTLSSNDLDCQHLGQRLNILSPENSLRFESDEAGDDDDHEDAWAYGAFFTDASLESVSNNVMTKTLLVRWPSTTTAATGSSKATVASDLCGIVRPAQDRTMFAQSSFFYPIAGSVAFAQPKRRPEATTVVMGDLHHLFDDKPSTSVSWSILSRNVNADLDDMSCSSRDRELFDPSSMGTDLCRKSKASCAIGLLSNQLGNVTVAGFDQADGTAAATAAAFSYASRAMPLGGPYSIVGQTLMMNATWVQACSNITGTPSLSVAGEGACTHGSVADHTHRGAAATFDGANGGLNGTLFMYQPVRTENDALPSTATSICNELQFSNGLKPSNLLFEILDAPNRNGTVDAQAVCKNTSAVVYNPFFVNVANKSYSSLCAKNPAQCALGDLTQRVQKAAPSLQCSCTTFLPVSGPFGVIGRVLRIRRSDNKQLLACSEVTSWDSASVDVYVPTVMSKGQIAKDISDEFQVDDQRVEVATSKDEAASSKYKGCVLYEISVFDPASSSIVDTLSKSLVDKQSPWSKKLGSDKCAPSSAIRFRLSVSTALVCFIIGLTLKKAELYS